MTNSHISQHNDVVKHKNRMIVEMARSMLNGKGFPNSF